jgi:ribosomal protein S18 acetylase RimI-like enzyme
MTVASALTVRLATAADAPALGRLGALLVRVHHEFDPLRFLAATPQTEAGYGRFLASQVAAEDAFVLVAERGGEVVGYAYATLEGHDWMSLRGPAGALHDLAVDPDHRRTGAGRALLDEMLRTLASHGAPRVVLSTAYANGMAQRLFAAAGFRPTMIEMTRETDA